MAFEPEAGHQNQDRGELDHDARPHQLVGPGPTEISALEQGENAQTEDDKDNGEQDVEQDIDERDHGRSCRPELENWQWRDAGRKLEKVSTSAFVAPELALNEQNDRHACSSCGKDLIVRESLTAFISGIETCVI